MKFGMMTHWTPENRFRTREILNLTLLTQMSQATIGHYWLILQKSLHSKAMSLGLYTCTYIFLNSIICFWYKLHCAIVKNQNFYFNLTVLGRSFFKPFPMETGVKMTLFCNCHISTPIWARTTCYSSFDL